MRFNKSNITIPPCISAQPHHSSITAYFLCDIFFAVQGDTNGYASGAGLLKIGRKVPH